MKTHRQGLACDFDPRGATENSSRRLDVTRGYGGRAAGGNGLCCWPVEVASLVESHCELREAFPGCERSGLATRNSPRYSLAVSTGWNNPLYPKTTQRELSVVLERHSRVPAACALPENVDSLAKHFQELCYVVQILRHRHKVSIEGHQCVAGTVVSIDRHPSEQRRKGCFRRRRSVRAWAPALRQSQATRSYLLLGSSGCHLKPAREISAVSASLAIRNNVNARSCRTLPPRPRGSSCSRGMG